MWEICAVRSVPRMSPFLCFVLFFFPGTSSINIESTKGWRTFIDARRKKNSPLLMSVHCWTDVFNLSGKKKKNGRIYLKRSFPGLA